MLAFEDHPPQFTPSVLDVPQGESTKVDLTAFTSAPIGSQSPDEAYTYALTSAPPPGVTVTLDGSNLALSVATSVPRGTVGGIGLSIDYGGLGVLTAQVDFRVTASSKPLARVVDQRVTTGVGGETTSVSALAGAFNPFSAPLTLVDAVPENPATGEAWVEGGRVHIRPAVDFLGPMVVRFRVRDATGDPDREVDGRITLVVRGRPDAPTAPRISEVRDSTVVLAWDAPAANGEPITDYQVTAQPGGAVTTCPSTTCTIDGLTNDVEYTFTVVARNVVGDVRPEPGLRSRPAGRQARRAVGAVADLGRLVRRGHLDGSGQHGFPDPRVPGGAQPGTARRERHGVDGLDVVHVHRPGQRHLLPGARPGDQRRTGPGRLERVVGGPGPRRRALAAGLGDRDPLAGGSGRPADHRHVDRLRPER